MSSISSPATPQKSNIVKPAEATPTHTYHAIKQIDLESTSDELSDIQQEIHILASFSNPYLTQYLGSYSLHSKLYIVMEYLPGGEECTVARSVAMRSSDERKDDSRAAQCERGRGIQSAPLNALTPVLAHSTSQGPCQTCSP